MPSRRAVALILTFWLATSAYVAYRDLWPRLFASGPPPVAIDLADEAAQTVPVRWTMSWNGQKVGRLVTHTKYVEADDTFRFTCDYKQLKVVYGEVEVHVPELTTVVRVTRSGDLREQSAQGKLRVVWNGLPIATADMKIAGTVTGEQLVAEVTGSYSVVGLPTESVNRRLDPVSVPEGQPLNPRQPVNRLVGVRPGRRWVVNESDPLRDAVAAVLEEAAGRYGIRPPQEKRGPLFGEVLSDQQVLDWHEQPVACWVIEYRRDEPEVRTWVRVSDGKVLKQEAYQKGDRLTVVRDD
jgi:hypothetical protein